MLFSTCFHYPNHPWAFLMLPGLTLSFGIVVCQDMRLQTMFSGSMERFFMMSSLTHTNIGLLVLTRSPFMSSKRATVVSNGILKFNNFHTDRQSNCLIIFQTLQIQRPSVASRTRMVWTEHQQFLNPILVLWRLSSSFWLASIYNIELWLNRKICFVFDADSDTKWIVGQLIPVVDIFNLVFTLENR